MPDPFRVATGKLLFPVRLFSVVLSLASAPAWAEAEIAVGGSVTDHQATAVAAVAWLPRLRELGAAVLRLELGGVYVDGRAGAPGRDLADPVVVGFLGLRYERSDSGLTLGAGIGAQAGYSDALSGGPQFITSLGWRRQRFSVLLRHISNAGRREPNGGETMLLGGWRF